MSILTEKQRREYWDKPLKGVSEQRAWLESYEETVVDAERQLAVLVDAAQVAINWAIGAPPFDTYKDDINALAEIVVPKLQGVLTPDLVARAADYQDAVQVRKRVRDLHTLTIATHNDTMAEVQQALLGKAETP